jgi:5-methylcytosine-specific restriction endonuclease McrBC regulatory subunit McrC
MFAYACKYEKCKTVYLIYPYLGNNPNKSYKSILNKEREVIFKLSFFDLLNNCLIEETKILSCKNLVATNKS